MAERQSDVPALFATPNCSKELPFFSLLPIMHLPCRGVALILLAGQCSLCSALSLMPFRKLFFLSAYVVGMVTTPGWLSVLDA